MSGSPNGSREASGNAAFGNAASAEMSSLSMQQDNSRGTSSGMTVCAICAGAYGASGTSTPLYHHVHGGARGVAAATIVAEATLVDAVHTEARAALSRQESSSSESLAPAATALILKQISTSNSRTQVRGSQELVQEAKRELPSNVATAAPPRSGRSAEPLEQSEASQQRHRFANAKSLPVKYAVRTSSYSSSASSSPLATVTRECIPQAPANLHGQGLAVPQEPSSGRVRAGQSSSASSTGPAVAAVNCVREAQEVCDDGASSLRHAENKPRSVSQHSVSQHSVGQHSASHHSVGQHSVSQHSVGQHSVSQHSGGQKNAQLTNPPLDEKHSRESSRMSRDSENKARSQSQSSSTSRDRGAGTDLPARSESTSETVESRRDSRVSIHLTPVVDVIISTVESSSTVEKKKQGVEVACVPRTPDLGFEETVEFGNVSAVSHGSADLDKAITAAIAKHLAEFHGIPSPAALSKQIENVVNQSRKSSLHSAEQRVTAEEILQIVQESIPRGSSNNASVHSFSEVVAEKVVGALERSRSKSSRMSSQLQGSVHGSVVSSHHSRGGSNSRNSQEALLSVAIAKQVEEARRCLSQSSHGKSSGSRHSSVRLSGAKDSPVVSGQASGSKSRESKRRSMSAASKSVSHSVSQSLEETHKTPATVNIHPKKSVSESSSSTSSIDQNREPELKRENEVRREEESRLEDMRREEEFRTQYMEYHNSQPFYRGAERVVPHMGEYVHGPTILPSIPQNGVVGTFSYGMPSGMPWPYDKYGPPIVPPNSPASPFVAERREPRTVETVTPSFPSQHFLAHATANFGTEPRRVSETVRSVGHVSEAATEASRSSQRPSAAREVGRPSAPLKSTVLIRSMSGSVSGAVEEVPTRHATLTELSVVVDQVAARDRSVQSKVDDTARGVVSVSDYYRPLPAEDWAEVPATAISSLGMTAPYEMNSVRTFEYLPVKMTPMDFTKVAPSPGLQTLDLEAPRRMPKNKSMSSEPPTTFRTRCSSCNQPVGSPCKCQCEKCESLRGAKAGSKSRLDHRKEEDRLVKEFEAIKSKPHHHRPPKPEAAAQPVEQVHERGLAERKPPKAQSHTRTPSNLAYPSPGEQVFKRVAYFHYCPELTTTKTNPFSVDAVNARSCDAGPLYTMSRAATLTGAGPTNMAARDAVDVYVTSLGEKYQKSAIYSARGRAPYDTDSEVSEMMIVPTTDMAPGTQVAMPSRYDNNSSPRRHNDAPSEKMPSNFCRCW